MHPPMIVMQELARIEFENKLDIAREARWRAQGTEGQVSRLTAFRLMLASLWQRWSRTEVQTGRQGLEQTEA